MQWKVTNTYSSDGCKWRCQNKNHVSIRKLSWFEGSNLTIEEIIELTYWWTAGNSINIAQITYTNHPQKHVITSTKQ